MRMKRKAIKIAKLNSKSIDEFERWNKNFYIKNHNNLKDCSCRMCGNPRKYFKEKTIQEKKFEEKYKFQIEDFFKNE